MLCGSGHVCVRRGRHRWFVTQTEVKAPRQHQGRRCLFWSLSLGVGADVDGSHSGRSKQGRVCVRRTKSGWKGRQGPDLAGPSEPRLGVGLDSRGPGELRMVLKQVMTFCFCKTMLAWAGEKDWCGDLSGRCLEPVQKSQESGLKE